MSVTLDSEVETRIRKHARKGYPEETCGFLLGQVGQGPFGQEPRVIEAMIPVPNQQQDERRRRFLMGPEAFREAERRALEEGLDVVGVYHSHPDHPAVPSEVDRKHAWPWYSYLIIAVTKGEPGPIRAWQLEEDRSDFREETLEVPEVGPSRT